MKKYTIAVAIIGLFFSPFFISAGWLKTYGGDEYDWGKCVHQTPVGDYIVVGTTKSFGSGDQDLWLLKTAENGDTQWTRTFGDSERNKGYCVDLTNDGGFIASGNSGLYKFNSADVLEWQNTYAAFFVQQTEDNGYILSATSNQRIWLIKMDENGDTIWTSTLSRGVGYCVQETSDGGYIVAGEIWEDTVGGPLDDLFIIKTDAQGNEQWSKAYWGISTGSGKFVQETFDSNYIVTGNYDGLDLCVLKIDKDGGTIWERVYAQGNGGNGTCIQQTSDSGFVLVGSWWTTVGNEPRSWLLKLDPWGDTLWTRIFSSQISEGKFVEQTSDKGFIVTGEIDNPPGFNSELLLIKTDSMGYVAVEEETPVLESDWYLGESIGRQINLHYTNCPQGFQAEVFDASGRKINEIRSHLPSATISWGGCCEPGVYFIKPVTDNRVQKVVLIK